MISPSRSLISLSALAALLLPFSAFASACPNITHTLARGASGSEVTSLQHFLVDEGELFSDAVTGTFGPLTETAVKDWQASKHIVSTGSATSTGWGVVGTKTRTAINASCDHRNVSQGQDLNAIVNAILHATSSGSTPSGSAAQGNAPVKTSTVGPGKCAVLQKPDDATCTSWVGKLDGTGCLSAWQCTAHAVVTTTATHNDTSADTNATSDTEDLNTLMNSFQQMLSTSGSATQPCWASGSCDQTLGQHAATSSYQYWCPGVGGFGYWSQTPCLTLDIGSNPSGSSGSGQLGQPCAYEGQSSFIACPNMSNCFGGGTYMSCHNGVWTQLSAERKSEVEVAAVLQALQSELQQLVTLLK